MCQSIDDYIIRWIDMLCCAILLLLLLLLLLEEEDERRDIIDFVFVGIVWAEIRHY